MNRRLFLSDLTRYAALCAVVPNQWRVVGRPRWADDPFTLGVASGDPTANGVVLWTRLARAELDLVTHLGDYIYEYAAIDGRPRRHSARECITLDDYRARYAQYKTDADLQAAHHRCPWVVTWDDHEVDNNYAGLTGEGGMESAEQMHLRRAAAYQAWWEHQPVRVPRAQSWGDLNITRTLDWGRLARFWVLDTRQYRSP